MGSAAAPTSSPAPVAASPGTVAGWHHNLTTVDLDALEALYEFLELSLYPDRAADRAADPYADRLHRGIDAALVTVYRQLLERTGRVIVSADLELVDRTDLNLRAGRCESPVCHLAHDVDGRHRKVAHI